MRKDALAKYTCFDLFSSLLALHPLPEECIVDSLTVVLDATTPSASSSVYRNSVVVFCISISNRCTKHIVNGQHQRLTMKGLDNPTPRGAAGCGRAAAGD